MLRLYFAEPLLTAGGDTHLHLSSLWTVAGAGRIVEALLKILHPRDQLRDAASTRTDTQRCSREHSMKSSKVSLDNVF